MIMIMIIMCAAFFLIKKNIFLDLCSSTASSNTCCLQLIHILGGEMCFPSWLEVVNILGIDVPEFV